MGILGGLLKLVDDIVSVPTDILGITNHHGKEKARRIAKAGYIEGKIDEAEYKRLLAWIDVQ